MWRLTPESIASLIDQPLPPALFFAGAPPALSPGASPGVTVQIQPDTIFTLPLGNDLNYDEEAQIPTVFDALITNSRPPC